MSNQPTTVKILEVLHHINAIEALGFDFIIMVADRAEDEIFYRQKGDSDDLLQALVNICEEDIAISRMITNTAAVLNERQA